MQRVVSGANHHGGSVCPDLVVEYHMSEKQVTYFVTYRVVGMCARNWWIVGCAIRTLLGRVVLV